MSEDPMPAPTPQATVVLVRTLLDDHGPDAVLHVTEDGGVYGLDVWVSPPAANVVLRRQDCLDQIGTDDIGSIDDQEIEDYLPVLQRQVDDVTADLSSLDAPLEEGKS